MSEPGRRWYHRPWCVLLVLFVVAGPFGLPLLWRSAYFGQRAKRALTVTVVLYTAALVWETVVMVRDVLDVLGTAPPSLTSS
jgi:hypothetical protein